MQTRRQGDFYITAPCGGIRLDSDIFYNVFFYTPQGKYQPYISVDLIDKTGIGTWLHPNQLQTVSFDRITGTEVIEIANYANLTPSEEPSDEITETFSLEALQDWSGLEYARVRGAWIESASVQWTSQPTEGQSTIVQYFPAPYNDGDKMIQPILSYTPDTSLFQISVKHKGFSQGAGPMIFFYIVRVQVQYND